MNPSFDLRNESDAFSTLDVSKLTAQLAQLNRQSTMPKSSLIDILKNTNLFELRRLLLDALSTDCEELTSLQLAVAIYAVLQGHLTADHRQIVGRCLLQLARTFVLAPSPSSQWPQLCALLETKPKFSLLGEFLEKKVVVDEEVADPHTTWTRLTNAFNPVGRHALKIDDLDYSLQPWLEQFATSHANDVSALLLVYYMCSELRPDQWSFTTLAHETPCQKFILDAICKTPNRQISLLLLLEFDDVLGYDRKIVTTPMLQHIFAYRPEVALEPAMCLTILDYQKNSPVLKLEMVDRTLNGMTSLTLSFLKELFARLSVLVAETREGADAERVQEIAAELLGRLLDIQWICSPPSRAVEDTVYKYSEPIDACITDLSSLVQGLYGKKSPFQGDIFSRARRSCLFALEHILPQSNPVSKGCIVQVLFQLYGLISSSRMKREIFEQLQVRLPPVVMGEDGNSLVKLCVFGQQQYKLSYEDVSITKPHEDDGRSSASHCSVSEIEF